MNSISAKENINTWLNRVLVAGLFSTLTGLLILDRTSAYHTTYYILVLIPTIAALSLHPKKTLTYISNTTKIFIIFAIWCSLSIIWSDTQENISTPIKRSLYIIALFMSFSIVHKKNQQTMIKIFISSGIVITTISCFSIYLFITNYQPGDRLIGTGALSNPLLSSHIFGLFSIFFLTLFIIEKNIKTRTAYLLAGLVLLSTVVATGSRTPILALVMSATWLALILKNKISIAIIAITAIILAVIYFLYPDAILSRGLSYRPELWVSALEKIAIKPLHGYGFDSETNFYIQSLDTSFREPHNIHLSILYFTGIIGFTLWFTMHAYGLWKCWQYKSNFLFIVASTLLIYGIGAGMTEGGGLLPRPKEHWFITWIPLAFISALLTIKPDKRATNNCIKN